MADTAVHSFVIRFVQEDPTLADWRGFIQHVQTHEELRFTRMQEAIQFMNRFVAAGQNDALWQSD